MPNYCVTSRPCAATTMPNGYAFTIDGRAIGSGRHVATAVAVDTQGNSLGLVLPFDVTNAPAVSLASPFDGAIANGSPRLQGAAASDRGGPVTTVFTLGTDTLFRTTAGTFDTTVPLTAIAPGRYTLTATATDTANLSTTVTRDLVVAASVAQV